MSQGLFESDIEDEALDIFHDTRYTVLYGYDVAPGERNQIRTSFEEYLIADRFYKDLPRDAQEAVLRVITNPRPPLSRTINPFPRQ